MFYIYTTYIFMFCFPGNKTILLTLYRKEGIFLLLHRWPGKLLPRSQLCHYIGERIDICCVIKSLLSRKAPEKDSVKHRSLERDINPHASGFVRTSNEQRLKQLLWATSSIINYCGVSWTVLAGCISQCQRQNLWVIWHCSLLWQYQFYSKSMF